MTGDARHIPETWLSLLGGRDAAGWLTAFADSPTQAVADLLRDAFYFGPLNLTNRAQLLQGWLDLIGNREEFAARLDTELTLWVEQHWGQYEPRAASSISAWLCLCSVVEFSARLPEDSRLKKCATALRLRFAESQRFLGSFSTAPAADPLGLYLAVIAEFQDEERSLAAFWHRICDLPDDVPFYHAPYGILGLRRLKAANPAEEGTLRAEVVLGLLRLARAFERLVLTRNLPEHIARAAFRRVAARTAEAYPNSPGWSRHGLAGALRLPERTRKWLVEAVPPLATAIRLENNKKGQHARNNPRNLLAPGSDWPERARQLAARLRRGERACLPEVQRLLDEERRYAEATGDTDPIARTLCNFATRTLRFSSHLARSWAEEARRWAPHDPFTWSTLRTTLLNEKQIAEALRYAWVAWKRFPQNDVSRNDLADVLKAANRNRDAEAIYRQTIELFPHDPVARNGLAGVLSVMRRYEDAIAVYRETLARFGDNVVESIVASNGLAGTLRRAGYYPEAEAEYRRSLEVYHAHHATLVSLASLVIRKGEAGRAEALSLVKHALELEPHDQRARQLQRELRPSAGADLDDLAAQWEQITEASLPPPAIVPPEEDELWTTDPETTGIDATIGELSEPDTSEIDALPSSDAEAAQPTTRPPDTIESGKAMSAAEETESQTSQQTQRPDIGASTQVNEQEAAAIESDAPVSDAPEAAAVEKPEPQLSREKKQEKTLAPQAGIREAKPVAHASVKETKPTTANATTPKDATTVAPDAKKVETRPRSSAYDPITLAALVAEAYFFRTWARGAPRGVAMLRRQKARELLNQATRLAPQDAQVLAEKIALSMDNGDTEAAYKNLTAQLDSHPAAAPLLVLKARFDRERARSEERRLDKSTLGELCIYPERLRGRNLALTPLFHLQKGLAALALTDGDVRAMEAARAFTKFRRLLGRNAADERIERASSHSRSSLDFHEWLQIQVDNRIFAGLGKPDETDLQPGDIALLESNLARHTSHVEEIEDAFTDRLAFAAITDRVIFASV